MTSGGDIAVAQSGATATPAHEATRTHLCKADGCPNESKGQHGPQSYCRTCQQSRGINVGGRPHGRAAHGPGSHAWRANEVAKAARRLDVAIEKHRQTGAAVKEAQKAYQEAVIALGGQS